MQIIILAYTIYQLYVDAVWWKILTRDELDDKLEAKPKR